MHVNTATDINVGILEFLRALLFCNMLEKDRKSQETK